MVRRRSAPVPQPKGNRSPGSSHAHRREPPRGREGDEGRPHPLAPEADVGRHPLGHGHGPQDVAPGETVVISPATSVATQMLPAAVTAMLSNLR
jgi:hypothetical protein